MSALLQNAVSAIRMGIEDYARATPDRSLSAVRNFYAGVLLLAKEVLARRAPQANPDEIIGSTYKPVPDPAGGVMYVPDGHRTIDFETTWRRFKDFGLAIDRAALGDLNRIRNDIEHRFTQQPEQVVREALSKAFPVTVALFRAANEDPRTLLGEAWLSMLEARALYDAELARCRSTLSAIKWHSQIVAAAHLRCTECESDLIEQQDSKNSEQDRMELSCQACGETITVDDAIAEVVERTLGGEAFERAKEGGEDGPIFDCPECARGTYIESENRCATCGYSLEWEDCARCHSGISLSDALDGFDGGICSYCSNLFDKDD
ncbi:MAG: hypothetical protein WDO56_09545 [Gammaproteobacteria bacterium]